MHRMLTYRNKIFTYSRKTESSRRTENRERFFLNNQTNFAILSIPEHFGNYRMKKYLAYEIVLFLIVAKLNRTQIQTL